jgi:ComF family protein
MLRYIKKISAWALPHVCIFCKNLSGRDQDLCQTCLQDLPFLRYGCMRCATPLPFSPQPLLCGQCLQTNSVFEQIHALFLYQAPLTKLILDLKFQHVLTHAKLLGELLAEKIAQDRYQAKPLPAAIIPVPLHDQRLKERGFNQAVEIAKPVAKKLHLPLLTQGFIRSKHTTAQAQLPAKQRKQNIHGAFMIEHDLKGQPIAVVDDVITTGSTINEFCRVLKKHGAGKIEVWCCARAASNATIIF